MFSAEYIAKSFPSDSMAASRPYFVQPKLSINDPGDEYEKQADEIADKVMRMSSLNTGLFFDASPVPIDPVQRKCADCEEEEKKMQRKEMNSDKKLADRSLENYVENLAWSGKPLPDEVCNFYEPRFGYDFNKVRIHTDPVAAKSAQSINALAYTYGNDIVFNEGEYSPNTDGGKKLLAHELTHVVQRGGTITGKTVQAKDDKKKTKDKEALKKESCAGFSHDESLATCKFDSYQDAVVRTIKGYAVRKCNKAILALDIPNNPDVANLANLIFKAESLPVKFLRDAVSSVRQKLEKTPIICKTCYDETCGGPSAPYAYVPPDDSFIGLCPGFFAKGILTDTILFLLHEAGHAADLDIGSRYKGRNEFYCNMDPEFNYWKNPCPWDMDNVHSADAWAYFIDRLSLTI